MFSPYKEYLLLYCKNLEDKPFQRRKKGLIEPLQRGLYFFKHPNEKNETEKRKAIILATIIHKINFIQNNNYFKNYYFGCIDFNPLEEEINFFYHPFFACIDEEIKVIDNYYEKDNDIYIKFLYEKMKNIKDKIELIYKEKKEKYLTINYLIKIIIQKIEELYIRVKLKKLIYKNK